MLWITSFLLGMFLVNIHSPCWIRRGLNPEPSEDVAIEFALHTQKVCILLSIPRKHPKKE